MSQSMIGECEKRSRISRKKNVRVDVLKKASIKTTDVSNVTPILSLADEYQRFGWTCSLNLYTEERKHKSLRNAGTNLQKHTMSHPRIVILTKAELHLLHNKVNTSVINLCSKIGFYKSQRREQSAACKSHLECCIHQISAVSFPAENVTKHTVYNIVTQAYIASLHPTWKRLISFTVRGAEKFCRCFTITCS